MEDKLAQIEARYERLNDLLSDPEVLGDREQLTRYTREQAGLQEVVGLYRQMKRLAEELEGARALLTDNRDPDLAELAREEARSLETRSEAVRGEPRPALLPKNPNDEKSVIFEIRAGAGGDEAGVFSPH